jgi:hypothetical protein
MNLTLFFAEWGDRTLVYLRGDSRSRTACEHSVSKLRQLGIEAEVVDIAPQGYAYEKANRIAPKVCAVVLNVKPSDMTGDTAFKVEEALMGAAGRADIIKLTR